MRSLLLVATCMLSSIVWGCGAPSRFEAHITGVVTEKPDQKEPTPKRFDLLARVEINGKPPAVPVARGSEMASRDIIVMEVARTTADRDEDFTMLFGRPFDAPHQAALGKFDNEGTFILSVGWIFLWGDAPMAKTEWGAAGADGTTIAIEVVGDELHRYYYVKGKAINPEPVWIKAGGNACELTQVGRFAELKADGSLDCINTIDDDPDAAAFIKKAKKYAKQVGWTP